MLIYLVLVSWSMGVVQVAGITKSNVFCLLKILELLVLSDGMMTGTFWERAIPQQQQKFLEDRPTPRIYCIRWNFAKVWAWYHKNRNTHICPITYELKISIHLTYISTNNVAEMHYCTESNQNKLFGQQTSANIKCLTHYHSIHVETSIHGHGVCCGIQILSIICLQKIK